MLPDNNTSKIREWVVTNYAVVGQ